MQKTITNALAWIILLFCICSAMTCSSKRTTEKDQMHGLVDKIKPKEVMIYGGTSTAFNNDQLQSRFFFVRHAEKVLRQKDPDLLPAGKNRAKRLAKILDEIPLRRIYSTNYRRTQLTAAPVAANMHLQVINYITKDFTSISDQLLQQPGNGNYLFVGHSNSVPNMVNHLAGKEVYQNIPEDVYDQLFVVSVYENKKVEVLELKY